jgi:hypothetical protein
VVGTEEYVYLKWFDTKRSSYVYIYNEKNPQTYIVTKDGGGDWKVDANIYPPPKEGAGTHWVAARRGKRVTGTG